MSYREAHQHILHSYMLKLSSAPFDIKDAQLLAKAGDCIKCPKRTGNQADLFGDVKSADVCTDPKCFDDKRQAHFSVARKKKEDAGHKVIYGADAKKLMPHWQNGNDWIQGDYWKLDAREYVSGSYVSIAAVVGKDYVPMLIQHPLTGKFIEVAPKSTVSANIAAQDEERRKNRRTSSPTTAARSSAALSPAKPREPDIEELVAQRVAEQLVKKPVALDRAGLLFLADDVSDRWDNIEDFLLKAFNLSTTGRPRFDKLSDKNLVRFLVIGSVVEGLLNRCGSQEKFAVEICRRHKIDPKKLKTEILAEQKKKKEEAAKPKVTASGAPTWSTPAPERPAAQKGKSDFLVPMQPSDQLAGITGAAPLVRTEITKKIWSYIKRNGLQDKKNRRFINVDDKLAAVLGSKKKQVSMFEMTKLVSKHVRIGRAKKKSR